MARTARVKSSSGIYHVTMRGVNRLDIFLDEEDSLFFLNSLRQLKVESGCTVLGFCLMSNHFHLLLREDEKQGLSKLMHRLGTIFAQWYNDKYERVGHVFQGRFHSSPVEDDSYLLTVLHYIHHNPVKSQLVGRCGAYRFTSYHAYASGEDPFRIVEIGMIADIAGGRKALLRVLDSPIDDSLDQLDAIPFSLEPYLDGRRLEEVLALSKTERNRILADVKKRSGYSLRQMASATGLSRSTIARLNETLGDCP